MNIKTHSRAFILLALTLTLLLVLAVSISSTFAEEHDTDATDDSTTVNIERDGDNALRDTFREQRDVRRDLFSTQQETI